MAQVTIHSLHLHACGQGCSVVLTDLHALVKEADEILQCQHGLIYGSNQLMSTAAILFELDFLSNTEQYSSTHS